MFSLIAATALLFAQEPVQPEAGPDQTTEEVLAERGVTDDDAVPFLIDLMCLNVTNKEKSREDISDEDRAALDNLGAFFMGRLTQNMNEDKYRTYAVATLAEEKVKEAGEEERPLIMGICRMQLTAGRMASLAIIEQLVEVAREKDAEAAADENSAD